jgi:formylmethanofuran dehydrogenase subunit E
MKLESSPEEKTNGMEFVQCEKCGNFSDDIAEIDGEWVCGECETNEPSE